MRYKRRPEVVEAFQYQRLESLEELQRWVLRVGFNPKKVFVQGSIKEFSLSVIDYKGDKVIVYPEDYIIVEDDGNLEAVNQKIFEAEYEKISSDKIGGPVPGCRGCENTQKQIDQHGCGWGHCSVHDWDGSERLTALDVLYPIKEAQS